MDHDKNPKIAIVHDAFIVKGGAERLAYYLSNIFSDAPVFTSIYQPEKSFQELKNRTVYTHRLNRLINNEKLFKQLFPLWFIYFYQKKFSQFDIVLSSSTYLAKYISPSAPTKHICYMHSPFRFLWKRASYTSNSLPFHSPMIKAIDSLLPGLQKIDHRLTQRIDRIITNSKNMSNFIQKVYQKDSHIIHPPVDLKRYQINQPENFYLCVSRLISYKKIHIAIEACNQLKKNLVIVGDGMERPYLESIAGPTISFAGRVDENTLKQYYSTCKALIFPGVEDFGMVPIEVQASGRPVIAYKAGGALETVMEHKTGLFFTQQNAQALIDCIINFEKTEFSPNEIRQAMQQFDLPGFEKKIKTLVYSEVEVKKN